MSTIRDKGLPRRGSSRFSKTTLATSHDPAGRISWPERLVLALSAAVMLVGLGAVAAVRLKHPDRVWTGAIGGGTPEDAQQYLAWFVDASHHLLVGNLFDLAAPSRTYLNPLISVSGALYRLGLPIEYCYAIWVPVAIVLLLFGTVKLCHRFLNTTAERTCALAIALLYAFPGDRFLRLLPEHGWVGRDGLMAADYDIRIPATMWGYPLSTISFALIPFALLAYASASDRGRRVSPLAAGALFLSAWLQPWQGLIACAMVGIASSVLIVRSLRGSGRIGWGSVVLPATTIAACSIPILYYQLLGSLDRAFAATMVNTEIMAITEKWWALILVTLPILIAAAPAFVMGRPFRIDELLLRSWAAGSLGVALAMSLLEVPAQSTHALRGISIPLGILSVTGVKLLSAQRKRLSVGVPLATGAAALAIVVPPNIEFVKWQVVAITEWPVKYGFFIHKDDNASLNWLRQNPEPGSVFTGAGGLSQFMPVRTGRQVWNGHWNWSPKSAPRRLAVDTAVGEKPGNIFMSGAEFGAATGARYVVLGCQSDHARAKKALGPEIAVRAKFGCSEVIELLAKPSAGSISFVEQFYSAAPPAR